MEKLKEKLVELETVKKILISQLKEPSIGIVTITDVVVFILVIYGVVIGANNPQVWVHDLEKGIIIPSIVWIILCFVLVFQVGFGVHSIIVNALNKQKKKKIKELEYKIITEEHKMNKLKVIDLAKEYFGSGLLIEKVEFVEQNIIEFQPNIVSGGRSVYGFDLNKNCFLAYEKLPEAKGLKEKKEIYLPKENEGKEEKEK